MTAPVTIVRAPSQLFSDGFKRWGRYGFISLGANALIWSIALLYLRVTPVVFTCEWSLILPGNGVGSNLNIADIGSVSSASSSPFNSGSPIDPRANYKAVAESNTVISAAADILKLTTQKFGKPRIKLVDQTSVIEFSINGSTPRLAQQKALALYAALQNRLSELRADESLRRQRSFREAIGSYGEKLVLAQKRVSEYKGQVGLVSVDQPKTLATLIDELRKQKIQLSARREYADARLVQLSRDLGLSAAEAADAFVLQADPLFQQHLKNLSESSALLAIYQSKWGTNHPQVVRELNRRQAVEQALYQRTARLLGHSLKGHALEQLGLTATGGSRGALLQELISLQAEVKGLSSEATMIGAQIIQMQPQLRTQTEQASTLEGLERNRQVAEAIFSSTLGKIDLGKTDIFASYPLVQMLIEPDLPDSPSAPKKSFVLLGALAASVLVTAGLTLLWLRNKKPAR